MYRVNDTPRGVDAENGGQRPCARGQHCAGRATQFQDGERVVVPAATYRVFCDLDQERIRDCLVEMPGRYRELGARIGDRASDAGLRVSGGGRAPGQPYNLGIDALQRQIVDVVLSWDERVRAPVKLAGLAAAGDGQAVAVACRALAGHVAVLLSLHPDGMTRKEDLSRLERLPADAVGLVYPYAEWVWYVADLGGREAGIEILNLHHRSLGMLGYTPQHEDLISRCWVEGCGERELRRWDGTAGLADHVECMRCGEQYLGSRLRALMVEEEAARERKQARERGEGRLVLSGGRQGYGGRP